MKAYIGFSLRLLYVLGIFALMFISVMISATVFNSVANAITINASERALIYNVQYCANLYSNGFLFVCIGMLVNTVIMVFQLFGVPFVGNKGRSLLSNYEPLEVCFDLILLAAYVGVAGLVILLVTGREGILFDLFVYGVLLWMLYPLSVRLVKHVNSTVQFTLPGGFLIE